jgi:hypothetical protein
MVSLRHDENFGQDEVAGEELSAGSLNPSYERMSRGVELWIVLEEINPQHRVGV